jgi:hypothetical protein
MVVSLNRANPASGGQDLYLTYRQYIQSHIVDNYCAAADYRSLVKYGIEVIGLDTQTTENALDLELERLGIANETRLLQELEAALHRLMTSGKKLGEKEKIDALQLVCKPRRGYRTGLNDGIAEGAITAYCRTNGVKVKTGLFSWAVPK